MNQIAMKLLSLAIQATPMMLAVLVLRLVFQQAPKRFRFIWWSLVGLSLLPISYPNIVPLLVPAAEQAAPMAENLPLLPLEDMRDWASLGNPEEWISIGEEATAPVESSITTAAASTKTLSLWSVLGWIWLAGFLVVVFYSVYQYYRIYRVTRVRLEDGSRIFLCDSITTAFVFGLIHPAIYLPSDLDQKAKDYIVMHEKMHIRRRDYISKLLGHCFVCVFWFHPLLWLCYHLFVNDIEYACDEAVVRQLTPEKKKEYSHVLVDATAGHYEIGQAFPSFEEGNIKRRIQEIVKSKKAKGWLVAFFAAAVILLAVFLLPHSSTEYTGTDSTAETSVSGPFSLEGLPLYANDLLNLWRDPDTEVFERMGWEKPEPIKTNLEDHYFVNGSGSVLGVISDGTLDYCGKKWGLRIVFSGEKPDPLKKEIWGLGCIQYDTVVENAEEAVILMDTIILQFKETVGEPMDLTGSWCYLMYDNKEETVGSMTRNETLYTAWDITPEETQEGVYFRLFLVLKPHYDETGKDQLGYSVRIRLYSTDKENWL